MKRIALILLLCLLSIFYQACKNTERPPIKKLPVPSFPYPKFDKISVKKIFSIDTIHGTCIPFSGGIIHIEFLDNNGKNFIIKHFNINGKLLKEKAGTKAQGPTDICLLSNWFIQGDRILFIDNNTYLKEINPIDLSIKALEKISNKIENYPTKYEFGINSGTNLEIFETLTITSLEATDPRALNYYIVSYNGNFEDFKILRKVFRQEPKHWQQMTKNSMKETIRDYNYVALKNRILAADWRNHFIFFIPDFDKPEIARIDFNGNNLTLIDLGINSKHYFTDKAKMDVWYSWALSDTPAWAKKNRKVINIYDKISPVLRDIAVFGDYLLVTTGKRNWETFENEVLVYQLPDLKFEGSFFIPTGDWPTMKNGKYLTIKRIIEKEDDYYFRNESYVMELK